MAMSRGGVALGVAALLPMAALLWQAPACSGMRVEESQSLAVAVGPPGAGLVRMGGNAIKLGLFGYGADKMLSHKQLGDGNYPGARVVKFANEPGCGTRLWLAATTYQDAKNPVNHVSDDIAKISGMSDWLKFGGKSNAKIADEAGETFEKYVIDEQARLDEMKNHFYDLKKDNALLAPVIGALENPINHALQPIPKEEIASRKQLVKEAVKQGIAAKPKGDKIVPQRDVMEVVRLAAAELVYSKAFVDACPTNLDRNLKELMKDTVAGAGGSK